MFDSYGFEFKKKRNEHAPTPFAKMSRVRKEEEHDLAIALLLPALS